VPTGGDVQVVGHSIVKARNAAWVGPGHWRRMWLIV
jgi:hypothetical protein